jgi:PAS domain S-box-containing protein
MDVTNHRRLEEVIRGQEARFRTLANAIPQLAWIADSQGRRSWFNERWLEYTGGDPELMQGLGWLACHDPAHAQSVLDGQIAAFAAGRPWEATVRLRGRDGQYRWFLSRAMPLRDEDGTIRVWFGTNTDVTDQIAGEERLRQSEAKMRRALVVREQVLAFVAHDLRNPVQTIVMAAGALTDLPLTPEKRERQLAVIKRSAWRMNELIADLLDVNLMEAGTFTVRPEPLSAAALLDDLLEGLAPQAAARGLALEVDSQGILPGFDGDHGRLLQVLSNLVGNALKFTPRDGRIRVTARAKDDEIVFSVEDTGPGISAEDCGHVFERFWQARRGEGGVGLGLAITKGIVEAHGGRVTLESELGKGTTFHVHLPVSSSQSRSASAVTGMGAATRTTAPLRS